MRPPSISPAPGDGRWLKVDLHLHTAEDPVDVVDLPAAELLDVAAARGFAILAITLHGAVLEDPELVARAWARNILLVPGAELRVEGADVVALNLTAAEAAATRTFEDLRRLRAKRGDSLFVLAPHPFYPAGASLGRARLEANRDCFDAVELCHLPAPLPAPWNPNARAARFARQHGLPLVGTSDAHQRAGFGAHFSWVRLAPGAGVPDAVSLFAALRAGQVRPARPGAWANFGHCLAVLWFIFALHPWRSRRGGRRDRAAAGATGEISFCPSR